MNFILNKVFDKAANKVVDNFSNLEQNDSIQINSILQDKKNTEASSSSSNAASSSSTKKNNGAFVKLIIILFLLYIFISSKFFTKTILVLFGKKIANSDGDITCIGTIIQGIIFICFYMLFVYLINKQII
jgi:uncharacterized integral membrane protein